MTRVDLSTFKNTVVAASRSDPFKSTATEKIPVPVPTFLGDNNKFPKIKEQGGSAFQYIENLCTFGEQVAGCFDGEIPQLKQKMMVAGVINSWEERRLALVKQLGAEHVPKRLTIQLVDEHRNATGAKAFTMLDYKEFVKALSSTFVNKEEGKKRLKAFLDYHQDENTSVNEYEMEFLHLNKEAKALSPEGMLSDQGVADKFIDGLHKVFFELKRSLRTKGFTTIKEILTDLAPNRAAADGNTTPKQIREEQSREIMTSYSAAFNPKGTSKEVTGQSQTSIQERLGKSQTGEKKESYAEQKHPNLQPQPVPRAKMSEEEYRQFTWNVFNFRKFKDLCTRCGQDGHRTWQENPQSKMCEVDKNDKKLVSKLRATQVWESQHGWDNTVDWEKKVKARDGNRWKANGGREGNTEQRTFPSRLEPRAQQENGSP